MGEMVRLACGACGYASETLALPPSPDRRRFDATLVACDGCKELTIVHRPKAQAGCAVCAKTLRVVDHDAAIACPRCGARLSRESIGLWD